MGLIKYFHNLIVCVCVSCDFGDKNAIKKKVYDCLHYSERVHSSVMVSVSTGAAQGISKWHPAPETPLLWQDPTPYSVDNHDGSAITVTDNRNSGAHYLRLIKMVNGMP